LGSNEQISFLKNEQLRWNVKAYLRLRVSLGELQLVQLVKVFVIKDTKFRPYLY